MLFIALFYTKKYNISHKKIHLKNFLICIYLFKIGKKKCEGELEGGNWDWEEWELGGGN